MAARTKTITALDARESAMRFYTADATSAHPNAIHVVVAIRTDDPDVEEVVDIRMESWNGTTHVANAPFTQTQVNQVKSILGALYSRALVVAGYT
jgi:hypothetical protein